MGIKQAREANKEAHWEKLGELEERRYKKRGAVSEKETFEEVLYAFRNSKYK